MSQKIKNFITLIQNREKKLAEWDKLHKAKNYCSLEDIDIPTIVIAEKTSHEFRTNVREVYTLDQEDINYFKRKFKKQLSQLREKDEELLDLQYQSLAKILST
jgi:hypothetical protein